MLSNDISKTIFHGNDLTTDFPFTFKVWDASQLLVQVTDAQGRTQDVHGWSVEISPSGGTVHYLHEGTPLPTGHTLVILRNMPFSQEVDLVNGTRFDPSVIEDALDKATAERQQLKEAVERSIRVDASSEDGPDKLIQELRDNAASAMASAQSAAQSETQANNSATAATTAAQAAQQSAEDAAQSAAEAGYAAGEEAVVRVKAEGDTQVGRVQSEGDMVLSTMADLAQTAFMAGVVVAFSGSFGGPNNKHPIPNGQTEPDFTWQLHEPSRGKFILGGTGQNQGAVPQEGESEATKPFTLTTSHMPMHSHSQALYPAATHSMDSGKFGGGTGGVYGSGVVSATGGSQPHSHGQNLPPYYTLAYIEKLPISGGGSGDVFVTKEHFDSAVQGLNTSIGAKQDELVSGANITMNGNVISATGGGSIAEAPQDGKQYARQNGSWSAVQGGSGALYDDTVIKKEISDVKEQIVYARPHTKGMVRISGNADAVMISVTGDDDFIEPNNFPLQGKPINVLCIGNSFSDDMTQWVGSLLTSANVQDFTIGNASIGGSSLATHVGNMGSSATSYSYYESSFATPVASSIKVTLLQAIQAQSWDVVTVQQVSGDSGMYDTITPSLQTLIDYVKENCVNKSVKIMYHMAWPYAKNSTHSDFVNYASSQQAMYEAQSETAKKILENYPDVYGIIPSNTVVQNARSVAELNAIGDELTRDGYHIDLEEGRTLLALGYIQNLLYPLYGVSIDSVVYSALPAGITTQLSKSEYDLMLPVVKKSFAHPFDAMTYYDGSYEAQKKLESGVSIKTLNGQSLLGSGNISISGGSGSAPNVIEDLVNKNISVSVAGNSIYKYGELNTLHLTAQDGAYVPSALYFTSGATPTVITYPSTAGHIPSLITPEANADYVLKVFGVDFQLIKRTAPVIPEIPEPPVGDFAEYTAYTVVQGYCDAAVEGKITKVQLVSTDSAIRISYTPSTLNQTASVSSTNAPLALQYITSKSPLTLPSGSKIQVLEGATARICHGDLDLLNASRGEPMEGPYEYTLEVDSVLLINTASAYATMQDALVLRQDLDSKLKILVPTDKLSQVNNNEV